MKNILKYIKDQHGQDLNEEQKEVLNTALVKHGKDDVMKVIKNYHCSTRRFDFDIIIKDFKKYLAYKKERPFPEYLNRLDFEARENLIDCHDEILLKCCSRMNYVYEPLVKKLYTCFTMENIKFWCIAGALYHDIIERVPTDPYKVVSEMGRTTFKQSCRDQYKRSNKFVKEFPEKIKDILGRSF